jgi:hypothetical protein
MFRFAGAILYRKIAKLANQLQRVSVQAPGVLHFCPGLLRCAFHRTGFESAQAEAGLGGTVQLAEAAGFSTRESATLPSTPISKASMTVPVSPLRSAFFG